MENGSATVNEIWDLIKETRIDMKESRTEMKEFRANMEELRASQKETDRQLKETGEKLQETAEQLKETDRQLKETDRQLKETDRQLKKTESMFTTQWGRLMESLVEGDLVELLCARGIDVIQTSSNVKTSFVGDGGVKQYKEFDILAVNGEEAVAVEVKTTLTPDKVKHFLSAMERFKRYFPLYRNMRVYGAVAYLKSDAEAAWFAERQGLFVIRATGDSASIVNQKDFRPKEFPAADAAWSL